jgi:hypothetical protein
VSRTLRYAAACGALVAVVAGLAAVMLDAGGVRGVLAAGAVALPVQVAAFAVLARARLGTNGFLLAWVGGTLVRLVVVGCAGWMLIGLPRLRLAPLPTLLGLAGFFFVMLMLEPAFLGLGRTRATRAQEKG